MLSRTLNQINRSPWGKLVWAVIGLLVLLQLVAFYRLCAAQVNRAQAREMMALEQRNALTDCLDYLPRSTISSCSLQSAGRAKADPASLEARDLPARTPQARRAVLSSAVPASHVFH